MQATAPTLRSTTLRRAAVLGAGTMGRAIAAHLANAGVPTLMLDLGDLASRARDALRRIDPAPLFLPEFDGLIDTGAIESDLARAGEADWIIEAIIEDLPAKQALLRQLRGHLRAGTIVTTNTSGLPVGSIAAEMDGEFRRSFLGAHFFNPPRYLKLLEIIPTGETDPGVTAQVTAWGDRLLGKGIVYCKDTPNFIANRIGTYGFLRAVGLLLEMGLTIEEVDELTGPLLGRPRSATFRTADLVGLDVGVMVADHAYEHLSADEAREVFRVPAPLREMVRLGWLGEKAGAGFYRRRDGEIEALDLTTMTYRPRRRPSFAWLDAVRAIEDPAERLRAAVKATDGGGRFLWTLLRDVLIYSARRIPEISDDIVNVDRATRWGFGWSAGPFETWDALGVAATVKRLERDGLEAPPVAAQVLRDGAGSFYRRTNGATQYFDFTGAAYRDLARLPGIIILADLKEGGAAVARNADASLVDLGDGVGCVEFHSKANAIGEGTLWMLAEGLHRLESDFEALVIGNQARNFSAGANLMWLLLEAQDGNWEELDLAIRRFQAVMQRIRYARAPVLGAPAGRTLGGGAEICLACARVQAAAETYMGLAETGVGLIPGGTGTTEMVRRAQGRIPAEVTADQLPLLRWTFETVALAKVSRSAHEAQRLGYLRDADGISLNTDRAIADAKTVALTMVQVGYRPPMAEQIRVSGQRGRAALESLLYILKTGEHITAYDEVVGRKLAHVMSGGDVPEGSWVSEEYLVDLEREAFLSLLGQPKTQERIRHTLQTGKPLRN